MSEFSIKQLNRDPNQDCALWEGFLTDVNGGTIFHNPIFLAYHGNRFNEHHIGIFKGEALIGLMPMAFISENGEIIAKSPYGASYGGFIFNKVLNYSESKAIVVAFKNYLQTFSVNKVIITPPITVYYSQYSDTFLFALLEQGFKTITSDITSIVDLASEDIEQVTFNSRARNMYRKAKKAGITAHLRDTRLLDFWSLMDKTFNKHGTNPTHTLKQWQWLSTHLPDSVWCDIAYIGDQPIAGIGHFRINQSTDSSFYLCSDPVFADKQGLSMLVYESVLQANKEKYKYFDFGTSSFNMVGRENIFRFKESFGAIGIFRHTYALIL